MLRKTVFYILQIHNQNEYIIKVAENGESKIKSVNWKENIIVIKVCKIGVNLKDMSILIHRPTTTTWIVHRYIAKWCQAHCVSQIL